MTSERKTETEYRRVKFVVISRGDEVNAAGIIVATRTVAKEKTYDPPLP